MKCAEAVEWMHRYIDHDLNDEEAAALFEHIRECSDCAQEFELLNELSAKLSELPDVTPRFSLVDRIMPQLDEIDRARREEGSALEHNSLIESAAAAAAASPRSMRSRSAKEAAQRGPRRRMRTGIFGTVAAAVILGIFITQYEPRTIPNAELPAADQSADFSNNHSSATSEMLMQSQDAAESGAAGAGDGAVGNSGKEQGVHSDGTGDLNAVTRKEEPSAGNAKQEKVTSNRGESKQDPSQEASSKPVNTDGNAGGSPAVPDAPRSGDNSGANDNRKNGTSEGQPAEGEPAAGEPASRADIGEHKMEMAPLAPDSSMSSPDESTSAQHYGFAAVPEEWSSPDGTHHAVLKDDHLYIYKVQNEEHQLVKDEQVIGVWLKGEWSGDSTKFIYEADVDGSVTKHTVAVKSAANAENSSESK